MIIELKTEEEFLEAFHVVKELRTHLNKDSYVHSLRVMKNEGYRMFALYVNEKIVAIAGIVIRTNFYYGKHLFVYDLVTVSSERSKGHGGKLLDYVHQLGKDNNCENVALESGLFRKEAHKFYEKNMEYEKYCYSFKKIL